MIALDRPPIDGEARHVIVPADVLNEAHQDAEPAPAAASSSGSAAPIDAPIDYTAEARDLVEFAHACFAPIYPSLEKVYTPDVRSRIAATAAPLMAKYNLNLGRLGPELAFAVTVLPLVVPTVQAIQHDRQVEKQKQNAPSSSSAAGTPAAANDASVGAAGDDDSPLTRFPGQT